MRRCVPSRAASRRLETEAAVSSLVLALRDGAEPVRQTAAQSLSELKNPEAGAWLLALADDGNAFVRAAGLRALRELRVAAAAGPALGSSRASACGACGARRSACSAAETSRGLAGARRSRNRRCGCRSAARRDRCARPDRCGPGGRSPHRATGAAGRAARRLVAGCARRPLPTLGKLRLAEAAPALIAALDDDYWQVRLRSARALGQLRAGAAIEGLGLALAHEISNLRKEAAIALGEIGDPAARPHARSRRVRRRPRSPQASRASRSRDSARSDSTSMTPLSLHLDGSQLRIEWPDGAQSLAAAHLRRHCRCADCQRIARLDWCRTAQPDCNWNKPLWSAAMVCNCSSANGHDRGIYPWSYLRELAAAGERNCRLTTPHSAPAPPSSPERRQPAGVAKLRNRLVQRSPRTAPVAASPVHERLSQQRLAEPGARRQVLRKRPCAHDRRVRVPARRIDIAEFEFRTGEQGQRTRARRVPFVLRLELRQRLLQLRARQTR